MVAQIALATISGKAYYRLVKELKKREVRFISLKPGDPVPLYIKVVITTEKEQNSIRHPHVLLYDEEEPDEVINKALQIIHGKEVYERVIVGVDPGKTTGIAVIADGELLKKSSCSDIKLVPVEIVKTLDKLKGNHKIVRIGNGVKKYQDQLIRFLDQKLSPEVIIESVSEQRTTKTGEKRMRSWRRRELDVISAIEISMRNGRKIKRSVKGE